MKLTIKIILAIVLIIAGAKAETDIEIGYTLPYLSEVRNAESYRGSYLHGGYRFDSGYGIVGEYNDLSIPLDSYNWFIGVDRKWKIYRNYIYFGAHVNDVRYKITFDDYTPLYRKVGVHSGGQHSQKYKGHGRLTDVILGLYYPIDKHFDVGVDYKVGNAQGNKGIHIQDRVNLYIRFSDLD